MSRLINKAKGAAPAKTKKGATRSGITASGSNLGERFFRLASRVLLLVIVVGSGLVLYKALPYLNPSIQQVQVEGDIQRLDKAMLSKAVHENLSGGILALDIEHLRTEIRQVPWVERVELVKHFPSRLSVHVVEEQAIAIWNDQGYISHQGEFIQSVLYEDLADLPQLSSAMETLSPEQGAKQAIDVFHLLNSSVLVHGQSILEMKQSLSGGWTMVWDNGLSIDLGRTNHLNRMRHALAAWQRLPEETKQRIDRIDARYENGVAIRLQQSLS